MLEQAKDHIERYFSVVGVLERYDETLALLSSTFGLPSLARNHVNRRPANRSGNPVPPHFAQQVRDRNPLDCALYEWIVKRFDGHMRLAKPILLPATTQPPSTPIPLWRAVGRSPLREAAMKQGGVPTRKPVPSGQIVALNGLRVRRNEQLIISDLTLRLSPATDKAATPRHQPLTLSMDADFARKMIDALQQAVDAAAQGPGIPKP
jgi:hypothetical protein